MNKGLFFLTLMSFILTQLHGQDSSFEMIDHSRESEVESRELKLVGYPPFFLNWHRYISFNLSSLYNLNGDVGIGLRKLGTSHGCDVGLNPSGGKGWFHLSGHGSYFYQFNAKEYSSYYIGIGAQTGSLWRKRLRENELGQFFISSPRYTLGKSFGSEDSRTQFFEVIAKWPIVYHIPSIGYYRGFTEYHTERVFFEFFYGFFF